MKRWPILLALACVVVSVGYFLRRYGEHERNWTPVLTGRLSDGSEVTFGWASGNVNGLYDHYLKVQTAERTRYYYVYEGGDPIDDVISMRTTSDQRGLWVEAFHGPIVIATLDLRTGEFLDLNGGVRPPSNRPRGGNSQRVRYSGYPKWARQGTGILLAARETAAPK